MGNNKNCTSCNVKLDINNYKKDRTICKECYNKNRRKKFNEQKFHTDVKKLFEPITYHTTDSSKENIFTLESLNNKINNVLELLEVIKSRLPRSTKITIT